MALQRALLEKICSNSNLFFSPWEDTYQRIVQKTNTKYSIVMCTYATNQEESSFRMENTKLLSIVKHRK